MAWVATSRPPARALARRVLEAGGVGVGLAAPGGAGVEGAVADDLQRPHGQAGGAGHERVAGAQPRGEHLVEGVGVRRPAHLERVAALVPALHPARRARAELEVDQAHHPERGGLGQGAGEGLGRGAVVADQARHPREGREPLRLAHHAVAHRQGEVHQRDGVEPAVVGIPADQHHRRAARDRVELGHGDLPVPAAGAVAPADDGLARRLLGHPLGHQRERGLGGGGGAEVEALGGEGPLREVGVLVPQARDEPPSGGVDLRHPGGPSQAGPELGHDAVDDEHVDRRVGGHLAVAQGHRPGAAHEEAGRRAGHGVTLATPRADGVGRVRAMVARVLGVVLTLLVLGAAAGYGIAVLRDDGPATIARAEPVPAASPSVPVEPEPTYAPDVDYPTLGSGLAYDQHVVGSAPFAWGYVAPRGWAANPIGPSEVTWEPDGSPSGSYGMRVKVVSERKTPAAMVEQKISDLADAVDDVVVLGRTTDSLAITFRASDSGRLRYNTFRWFTADGSADAQFEVSVNGRARDLPGLGDLLDQVAASVRFDPPEPSETPTPG
jgi:hypothetical protein